MSSYNNPFNNDINDNDDNECGYESDFDDIESPDFVEDVVNNTKSDVESIKSTVPSTKPIFNKPADPIVVKSPSFSVPIAAPLAPELDPANDPKTMIKYQGCLIGAIINLIIAIGFGYLIFKQFQLVGNIGESDRLVLGSVFKIRYALVFVYFLVSLLHKPYVHEFRNSETPVIAYSILEIYYNLYDPAEASIYGLMGAVILPTVCCIRRKKFMNFFNPWNKDKTDIKKLIAAAKRLITDLNDF